MLTAELPEPLEGTEDVVLSVEELPVSSAGREVPSVTYCWDT